MKKWKIKKVEQGSADRWAGFHPVVEMLLRQRGCQTVQQAEIFLSPDYERDIHDPFLFSSMTKAVERIQKALKENELIAIYGDYDADGVTAAVVLKETLDILNARSLVYIPDKKLEGYGLNQAVIAQFKNQGVNLIITVDCGITNKEEILFSQSQGIDVIITDHHHVPAETPPACAILNPCCSQSGYPESKLAGVGVSFKLAQALFRKLMPDKKDQEKWLLDLAAIGTVADCVPLTGENRAIVKYGLIVLSKTRRIGLRELFAVGRISIDENNLPETRQISFQIAPRINAAGRMNHANKAFNLIMEKDRVKARLLALELEENNQHRQKETDRVYQEVRSLALSQAVDKKIILAINEHYPLGTAGLVAGKIAEEFKKPVGIFQKEEKISRGSFRSIPQINIIEALEKFRPLLVKCGGHAQAAGVTISNEKIEEFFGLFENYISKISQNLDNFPVVEIDCEVQSADIGFNLASLLRKLEPFGEGNPQPVFLLRRSKISQLQAVGNGEKHLKIYLQAGDGTPKIFEGIGFNLNQNFKHLKKGEEVDAVFSLETDEWNGQQKIQLKILDIAYSHENRARS